MGLSINIRIVMLRSLMEGKSVFGIPILIDVSISITLVYVVRSEQSLMMVAIVRGVAMNCRGVVRGVGGVVWRLFVVVIGAEAVNID